MKYKIGVFGSAAGDELERGLEAARVIGWMIADQDFLLVTGACPGLPFEAARAAIRHGGKVLGISPAASLKEHVEAYKFPGDWHSTLVFTGFGKKGRNVISVRTCDAAIFIQGRTGTLNEFSIAYDEGGPGYVIGVLTGRGGICDQLPGLVAGLGKPSQAKLLFLNDPEQLVRDVVSQLKMLHI